MVSTILSDRNSLSESSDRCACFKSEAGSNRIGSGEAEGIPDIVKTFSGVERCRATRSMMSVG